MSLTELISAVQNSSWDILNTDYGVEMPHMTFESRFQNSTNMSIENSTYNHQKDNDSLEKYNMSTVIQSINNNNTSVYFLYPSGILWFGAISCILFSIIGTSGNFISILALVKCRRLKNATTAFIVNLCASDMLYCAFTMPLTAVTFIDRDWYNGDALCKLFALVKFSNGIVSIFTVVAITINRYVLIVHPKLYRILYSPRNTIINIACLWLLPLILISMPLFNVWGTLNYNPAVGDCGVNDLRGKSPRAMIFFVIIILPSVLFICCYLKIYFVVKNSVGNVKKQEREEIPDQRESVVGNVYRLQKKSKSEKENGSVSLRDKKEFRVLRIVLVIFIFYSLSTFPIALIKLFRKEGKLHVLNVLAYVVYFSSSVFNPVVYIVMSREYRLAYKDLFRSAGCYTPDETSDVTSEISMKDTDDVIRCR